MNIIPNIVQYHDQLPISHHREASGFIDNVRHRGIVAIENRTVEVPLILGDDTFLHQGSQFIYKVGLLMPLLELSSWASLSFWQL